MKEEDKDAKLDYVITRINKVIAASKANEDILQKLSELDAAQEAAVQEAETLFGSRDSYLKEMDRLITESHLVLTCGDCKEVIEYVAEEIVDFVERAKAILQDRNPYKKERVALIRYQHYTDSEFADSWKPLYQSLTATYHREQLDATFYDKELSRIFVGSSAYSLTRYELLRDWERQLLIKEIDFELHMLSALRRKFYSAFREKLIEFHLAIGKPYFDLVYVDLFWSLHQGHWHSAPFDLIAKYALLIQQNQSIQRLLSELGRKGLSEGVESVNVKIKSEKYHFTHAQKSDVVGITDGDDLSSLLPVEIAMLSDVKLENDFYKRYTERKLQTFAYASKVMRPEDSTEEQVKQKEEKSGPFIVCIDTSGSMSGVPENLAKTICYGLIIKAREQHRNCFVITFSTKVKVLDISDLKNNFSAIVEFLMHSFDGGTDLVPAMRKAMEMLTDERYRKADVLFISDFVADDFDDTLIQTILAAQSLNTRLHALQIGDFNNCALLNNFDMLWEYQSGQIILTKSDSKIWQLCPIWAYWSKIVHNHVLIG